MRRRLGLLSGPIVLLAVAFAPAPAGMDRNAQLTAAITLMMAVWWLTEAVPVAVTGLVPLVGFPVVGVMSAADIAAPYASQTNMLFLGGLIIATAIERWGLHRRIALNTVAKFGRTPSTLVLGFMVGTACVSAWISNSATTMMMLPIAMAVIQYFRETDAELGNTLAPILMLAVAYSATIGGLATIVSTPPNAVFVGAFRQLFPQAPEIGFLQWMLVGVPIAAIMIPLAWFYLVRIATKLGRRKIRVDMASIHSQLEGLGKLSGAELRVLIVFCITAALWMFRRDINLGSATLHGWASWLPMPSAVGDSTVAMTMALALFVLPAGKGSKDRLLDWETAVRLPWGVIVLLGGGFALAEAIRVSGLAEWLGGNLAWVGDAPPLLSIAMIALAISFATEITTNTAITTIMMPILASSAVASGSDPLLLMVPCTLAASLCFMMPSGTAPNAIVFSGGELTVPLMARVGVGLNLIAVIVVTAMTYFVAVPVFDIQVSGQPAWVID